MRWVGESNGPVYGRTLQACSCRRHNPARMFGVSLAASALVAAR